jgi:hypothetical protein
MSIIARIGEDKPMFCTKCGAQMPDDAKFCTTCGQAVEGVSAAMPAPEAQPAQTPPPPPPPAQPVYAPPPPTPPVQPVYAQPAYTPPPAQPVYAAPPPAFGQPAQPVIKPRKKRRIGCWIFLVLFLAIVGAVTYFIATFAWLPPRDLGIRYTQADFDRAVEKIGLQVDFEGKSSDEMTALIKENRNKQIPLDDYKFVFSDYQERSFELSQEEVTAFINEIAPPFSWFESVQVKVLGDGRTAGSYKVRFDKIKAELIPDVADQIPAEIGRFLPKTFNLYMEGSFEIVENDVRVPEKLDKLEIGAVNMQPVINGVFGELTEGERASVFDYTERIIQKIPDLIIHSLRVNDNGNYEISAYMPTHVTVTHK